MKKLSLNEIKQIELDILLELDDFCSKNGIIVYLCGGTLLGAVRHKGFIPWDDDIDVLMPRDDYLRFLELVKQDGVLPEHLCVNAYELNNAFFPFAKMFDKRTHIDQKYTKDKSLDHIWIDIFPVDGLPESLLKTRLVYWKNSFYRKLLLMNYAKANEGTTAFRRIVKNIIAPLVKKRGPEFWCRLIYNESVRYSIDDSCYLGIISWGLYGKNERMRKDSFFKPTTVEFEKHFFNTMLCWDEYLSNLYGDYMQLPPENKRKTHSFHAWIE